jgi:hypothetical protein
MTRRIARERAPAHACTGSTPTLKRDRHLANALILDDGCGPGSSGAEERAELERPRGHHPNLFRLPFPILLSKSSPKTKQSRDREGAGSRLAASKPLAYARGSDRNAVLGYVPGTVSLGVIRWSAAARALATQPQAARARAQIPPSFARGDDSVDGLVCGTFPSPSPLMILIAAVRHSVYTPGSTKGEAGQRGERS